MTGLRRLAAGVGLVVALGSCGETLEAGAWGELRFMARVKGAPPLALVAPISDRSGNLYTLYGAIGLPEVAGFVTRATGGSGEACTLTKGDNFGAHGWVGFADDRAWYWSGDWLVEMAAFEPCETILAQDPKTNVELRFAAVMPYVRVTPSRSSLVALIRTANDPIPFAAAVDLTRKVTTNVTVLPIDADDVRVLGVGADRPSASGFALLAVTKDGATTMRAVYLDENGSVTALVPVRGQTPPEYGVLGWLEQSAGGAVVGLTSLRSLVVFDRSGGRTVDLDDTLVPAGLHRWNGELFLVGTAGDRPAIRTVSDSGVVGPITSWTSSGVAAAGLGGPQEVRDDRQLPVRVTTWPEVGTAIGAHPFLGPHSPWPHAKGTTLWAAAGPRTDAGGGRIITSIAIAPVGISYP